jgi:predicted O-linked N-acetylglucosamine transferase (SPINDLY family)
MSDLHNYEEKAVDLGANGTEVARLKAMLSKSHNKTHIFNTPTFVKNLESSITQLISQSVL